MRCVLSLGLTLFSRQMNLHSLWDTGMIKQTGMPYEVYAARLEEALTPEVEAASVAEMDPVAWAGESHGLWARATSTDVRGDPRREAIAKYHSKC